MVKKTPKDGMQDPGTRYREEGRMLTDAEWDAWGERNKDALQASFEKARAEYEQGRYFTLEETMARVKATIKRSAKKA